MEKDKLKKALQDVFGFSEFRGEQEAAVSAALNGEDSLVLMPTGSGKSLCYQLPAKLSAGLTLVISPLIALMKDQVDQALKRGFKTCYINSSLSHDERKKRYARLARAEFELVYVTPERFRKTEFREALKSGRSISLLAIDEAHCVSQWGHDFRPDYSRIAEFREFLKDPATGRPPTTMCLTATATPRVQTDILKQTGLDEKQTAIFSSGMERPNLKFTVLDPHGLDQKVQAFVAWRHQNPGPTIVYFSLIQSLMKFARDVNKLGIDFLVYHGDLPAHARKRNQERFLDGEVDLILATPAFGLGVDKADVRLIVHGEIPGSLEAYYQEAGRAGRDGKPAECLLLYDADDVTIQMDFLKWANPEPSFLKSVYDLIERNPLRWRQEGFDFLRDQMNYYNSRDFRVETAVNQLERAGFLEPDETEAQPNNALTWKPAAPPEGPLVDPDLFATRQRAHQMRLMEMVRYASGDGVECRAQFIYEYFGRKDAPKCGLCDLCQAKS